MVRCALGGDAAGDETASAPSKSSRASIASAVRAVLAARRGAHALGLALHQQQRQIEIVHHEIERHRNIGAAPGPRALAHAFDAGRASPARRTAPSLRTPGAPDARRRARACSLAASVDQRRAVVRRPSRAAFRPAHACRLQARAARHAPWNEGGRGDGDDVDRRQAAHRAWRSSPRRCVSASCCARSIVGIVTRRRSCTRASSAYLRAWMRPKAPAPSTPARSLLTRPSPTSRGCAADRRPCLFARR